MGRGLQGLAAYGEKGGIGRSVKEKREMRNKRVEGGKLAPNPLRTRRVRTKKCPREKQESGGVVLNIGRLTYPNLYIQKKKKIPS